MMVRLDLALVAGICVAGGLSGCTTIAPATSSPQIAATPAQSSVTIGVDTRAELFMTIFRLAGAREFSGGNPRYVRALDAHFKPFADHPAVAMARKLQATQGISYNAVPELAVAVGPLPELAEQVPLERQPSLDPRWTVASARAFLVAARDFARDTKAVDFYRSQGPLFHALDRRLRNLVDNEADLDWVRRFYGDSGGDRFVIVPAMLAHQGNYGARILAADGRNDLYAFLGVYSTDEDENPAFGVSQAFVLAHEFGHSFVNPLIIAHEEELMPVSKALFDQSPEGMSSIGYSRPTIVLYETIIRAGVARYKLAHGGAEVAERELERQRQLGFVWIDEFYDLLGRYEQDRIKYPTLAAFYPIMTAHLAALPARLPAIAQNYNQRRPKIVEITPALASGPIDPSTREIRIHFDRPMDQRWGFNMDVARSLPDVTGIRLADGNTVMVIGVKLEPSEAYDLPFFAAGDNAPRAKSDGVLLAPTTLRFTTGPAKRGSKAR